VPPDAVDEVNTLVVTNKCERLRAVQSDSPAGVCRVLAELVDLKFFCGLTFAEIAAHRNLSERTVQRNWEKARVFLYRNIRADLEV